MYSYALLSIFKLLLNERLLYRVATGYPGLFVFNAGYIIFNTNGMAYKNTKNYTWFCQLSLLLTLPLKSVWSGNLYLRNDGCKTNM